MKYAITEQCEPNRDTKWEPLCLACTLESLIKERDTLEAKLQKLIDRDTIVPPPIRHSSFLSAVKRLDRLDSEIAKISQQVYDLRGTK